MKIEKSIIGVSVLAIGLAVSAFLLAKGFSRKPAGEYINATGMAEFDFTSDLVIWSADYSRIELDLKTAYQNLKTDQIAVQTFLKKAGILDSEMIVGTINIEKQFDYINEANSNRRVFLGYRVSQTITVKSKRVDEVTRISRESMSLIEQGLEFNSHNPEFYYTKLSTLKLDLIEKATKDARNRAEKIAIAAGANLGNLKKSNLGVFQITAQNDNEDYSWGGVFNTSSLLKTARVTVSVSYIPD